MFAGIIIWVSVRDVGQLKDSVSSYIVIPICSAFSRETQLWGLCQSTRPWAGRWLNAVVFSALLYFYFTVDQMLENTALSHVFLTLSLNFQSLSWPFCSTAAHAGSKQVMFMVELGNRVSRIYPVNLAGDLHGTEKGSNSFGFQW